MEKQDFKWHRHRNEAPQRAGAVLVATKQSSGEWSYTAARWVMPNSYCKDGEYCTSDGYGVSHRHCDVYWKYIEAPTEELL